MLGRTHELGGISALIMSDVLIKGISVSTPTAFACVFFALAGSLSPDLDKPTSLIYTKIPGGTILGKLFHPLFIGGHRHLSHSIIGFIGFSALIHYLLVTYLSIHGLTITYVWYAYMIGFASHLLLDALTTEGIPLFFPIPIKIGIPPFRHLRIVTGSWVEHLIVFPLLLLATGYFFIHYFSYFTK